MVIAQLTQDTTGVHALWRIIEQLSQQAATIDPNSSSDWASFGLQALVILLALLVLAIFALSAAILWIFSKWRSDQAAGIKALSSSKDATKREITQLLRDELGNARAANAADFKELREVVREHGNALNTVRVDLALLGQKAKINILSATKKPEKDGE